MTITHLTNKAIAVTGLPDEPFIIGEFKTLEYFIKKAKIHHGDRYDYSKSIYIGMRSKITITCPDHGDFEQIAYNHTLGKGCKKCAIIENIKAVKKFRLAKRMDVSGIEVPVGAKSIPISATEYTLVDEEDYDKAMNYIWHAQRTSHGTYAVTNVSDNKIFKLHNLIMNVTDRTLMVDHIYHNTLDNRKSQLRLATKKENSLNSRGNKKSTSKYKGVHWSTARSMWCASIGLNRKKKSLGRFHSETDAAKAYDKAAIELFGEYAYLNFPKNLDPLLNHLILIQ